MAIEVIKANESHVDGIAKVCTDGYWATYGSSHPEGYIHRIVDEFYNRNRILKEVKETNRYWGGYFVAVDGDKVLGAGGGGLTDEATGEVYVLYMDPDRKNEGIGTQILNAITAQQKSFGAMKQWVSVQKGNTMGIPFYEAKGFTFQFEKQGYGNEEGGNFIVFRQKTPSSVVCMTKLNDRWEMNVG
ncbi:GNAT family N-acetyltransferase [Virgibacillus halodenitrificans]|uniref:GNAT family N-acetyltransferase n=1 Tax=Virgibacillus halodenitrificans TaxID=1482 RepID=UPI00045CC4F8|nr:GNAT family N-acetyltransferase [Virgibacillus halodenitrificans]MCJ0933277.1 GNAT family N-acetyltransferase [Virgibacillus halodenitrificans]CDQ32445.1 putative acetyltransferase [Virgibacillus halodenitrificans]